jgi:hypothetical protein
MHVRTARRNVTLAVTALVCFLTFVLGDPGAGASGASPSITVATGGGGVAVIPGFTAFDPAAVGYEQSEVFLSGTANAYEPTAPLGTDGKYGVAPTSTAPYTTRAVVMRPVKPRRFSGTVVVEWLNVTGGADAGTDWMLAHNELVREGFVWVGVSAQKVGVDALKSTDPQRGDAARYAGLSHPGDSFSYDIFSQGGQAIRDNADVMLGGLRPKHVIAVGESQSAGRLVTYIDAVHPLVHVYDGFLVHSRGAGGAPLSQAPQPSVPVPTPAPIRDDLGVPVLVFQAENDVFNSNLNARQPDTDTYRLWEVAGTAHFDFYGLTIQQNDIGDGKGAVLVLESMQSPTNQPTPNFTCNSPVNTGPAHYALDAAFSKVNQWVVSDVLPPIAPRLQTTGVSPVAFATDANGNVLGGVRTPAVDTPVAKLSGLGQGGNQFCFLFGSTVPFTPDQLAALYKNHGAFASAWVRATKSARKGGFVVGADAREIIAAGVQSDIGK